jgi:PAS domain S-box-containing protein
VNLLEIQIGAFLAIGLGLGLVWALAAADARRRSARMTQTLRASEARVRAVVDNVVDGIVTLDEHGMIEASNPAVRRLFGYEASELIGRNIDVLLRSGGSELPAEGGGDLEGLRKDGSRFAVEFSISEMHVEDERLFTGILRDVSERRRGERRRAAQFEATRILAEGRAVEETLPRMLEAVCRALGWEFGAFWKLDRQTARLGCAASWSGPGLGGDFLEATHGLALAKGEGLPGRAWELGAPLWSTDLPSDVVVHRSSAARRDGLRSGAAFPVLLGGELTGVVEFFNLRNDGRDEELLQMFATVGSQIGQFLERRRTEEALLASEARTGSILDNMLEGLIVVNGDNMIEAVNPAAERTFGYPSHEMVGQSLKMLLPRARMANSESYLRDARKRAMGKVTTWEGRRKNGALFPFELSLYEFTTGAGRRFAGHVRDVSERREVDRMKKEFVATVSHELRTPLTSIRGSLTLLAAGVLGTLEPDVAEAVGIAERNAIHLIDLINDILDLERLENGRMEMEMRPMSIGPALARAHDAVRGMAEDKGVAVALELADVQVVGDENRLVQVVVNLLSNAVKFSPRGAAITVCAQETAGFVEVSVRDRGRGVPRSYQRSIFERFQQVEASDSRQKGGTGLGLAICKTIVEQHGGTIGVESDVGRGSTFWFRIPAVPIASAIPGPVGDRAFGALTA